MEVLGTNIVDPDQTPHSVVSDLGLHCLHMSPKPISCPKRAKCSSLDKFYIFLCSSGHHFKEFF